MNINNFSSGIISSAAYSRLRDISAADAANVHHDDEGALVTRLGHRRIPSGRDTITSIFAHWTYVLCVTGAGELKWETETRILNAGAGDDLFRSFIPARTGFDVTTPTRFITDENSVFVSNANVQLKVVLTAESDPVAYPFYLPHLGAITVRWTGSGDDVYLRLQPIKTLSQPDDEPFWNYPIEAVGRSGLAASQVPNDAVLDIDIEASDLASDTDADYIDVFQTQSTAETSDAEYFYIGRIPYQVGTHRLSTIADTDLETERTLIEPLDEPVWEIEGRSNERLYLNTGKDNRVWMTYHDSGEKYLRSVTDYIDVNTGGYRLTGLKTLGQDTLAVYTENRIFLMSTDPIGELHRVYEVVSSRDDRDAPIGCIASESLVDIDGDHYFLSGNRQIYSFNGQRVKWVSAAINPTLAKVPRDGAKSAVGFARALTYCLCYPSEPASDGNDAMVLFDTQRNLWWKDDLPIAEVSKGHTQYEYGLIDGWPALLNTGDLDNGEPIEWSWRGNKLLIPLNTLIHSLFIGVLPEDIGVETVEISVTLKTEEGEQTRTIEVSRALNYWDQYVGFNLRGRSVQVTLSGRGAMKIDRLLFNPEP